jgi:hypothetical protein
MPKNRDRSPLLVQWENWKHEIDYLFYCWGRAVPAAHSCRNILAEKRRISNTTGLRLTKNMPKFKVY